MVGGGAKVPVTGQSIENAPVNQHLRKETRRESIPEMYFTKG